MPETGLPNMMASVLAIRRWSSADAAASALLTPPIDGAPPSNTRVSANAMSTYWLDSIRGRNTSLLK